MSIRFNHCLKFVLRWEGKRSDNPADRGGRTAFGITQGSYNVYRRKHGHSITDVWGITESEIHEIYWEMYWLPARCSLLPEPLDLLVFDSSVQHGAKRAVKLLQKSLGVTDDGAFGPVTIDALTEEVAAGRVDDLASSYLHHRTEFYADIVKRDPTQKVFERGWMNRLAALRTDIFGLGE